MKDCEDCTMNTICTYYDKEQKRANGKCPGWRWYRKCWVIIILAVVLSGCVLVKLPDGTEYLRIGPQEIGEVLIEFPNGTQFLMESQKAEMPKVEITATSITIGKKVGQ